MGFIISRMLAGACGAALGAVFVVQSGCALIAGVEEGELAGATSTTDGVSVRGVDQYQSDNTSSFALTPTPLAEIGDFSFLVILRTGHPPPELTAPDGFQLRQASSFACGYRASAMDIYSRVVTGAEPTSFEFSVAEESAVSAILVTFAGLSGLVESSTFVNALDNPMTLEPLANGDRPSFGFAMFTGGAGGVPAGFSTFTIPPGKTRIVEAYSIALFGDDVGSGEDFVNDAVEANPEHCGFAYAALLSRP